MHALLIPLVAAMLSTSALAANDSAMRDVHGLEDSRPSLIISDPANTLANSNLPADPQPAIVKIPVRQVTPALTTVPVNKNYPTAKSTIGFMDVKESFYAFLSGGIQTWMLILGIIAVLCNSWLSRRRLARSILLELKQSPAHLNFFIQHFQANVLSDKQMNFFPRTPISALIQKSFSGPVAAENTSHTLMPATELKSETLRESKKPVQVEHSDLPLGKTSIRPVSVLATRPKVMRPSASSETPKITVTEAPVQAVAIAAPTPNTQRDLVSTPGSVPASIATATQAALSKAVPVKALEPSTLINLARNAALNRTGLNNA